MQQATATTQQHAVTYVRQEKNRRFANDGSLESVQRQIEKLTFQFYARVRTLGLSMNEDDVRQELHLAYVKAKNGWRPDGGALFVTYFTTVARNHFNNRVEKPILERTELGMVSYHDVMRGATDEETGDPLEFMHSEDDVEHSPEDAAIAREEFRERMGSLSPAAQRLMAALIRDEGKRDAGKPPRLRDIAKQINMPLDEITRVKVELMQRFGTTFV